MSDAERKRNGWKGAGGWGMVSSYDGKWQRKPSRELKTEAGLEEAAAQKIRWIDGNVSMIKFVFRNTCLIRWLF